MFLPGYSSRNLELGQNILESIAEGVPREVE